MDELDNLIILALRRDGRATVSQIAQDLGVTRATVKSRMDRMQSDGTIAGFTVLTQADVALHRVRGLMMLGIEGRGTETLMRALARMVEVQAVHSTNGSWDLILELGTETLDALDRVLFRIRRMEGVTRSETQLLLSTRRAGG